MSDFENFKPYEILNQTIQGNNNTVFLFPPGEGGGESYINNIVTKLDDKKIVMFNSYFGYLKKKLGVEYISHVTFEQLANDHICYIKFIQPVGPYNLFGWSFGGVLAFEVARQLVELGDRVSNIILIDPFFNFKKAILETNLPLDIADTIHYHYCPTLSSKMFQANIVLFKALKVENNLESESTQRIYKYYVENTQVNNLDHLLKGENFKLITMDHDHSSWRNDESQIIKIAQQIEVISLDYSES